MSNMQTAYKLAAASVRQRFAEQHPKILDILNLISKDDIAVYSGSFDKVEEVLKSLTVPYNMNPNSAKLKAEIAFMNCSGSYDNKLITDLSKQVENGKYLVSSDWALGHFIAKAFPNTVKPTKNTTKDEVISVEANLNSLWSEVVVLGADPQWWLETSSHPIEILNPDKVRIEAASHDLLRGYNAPVVAVSFDWGKGHVFHVISHFWCKRTRNLTPRHQAPCTDFLEAGMKLSPEGIEKVLRETNIQANTLNFAQIQSAATATELIAQLCVKAVGKLVMSR
ncbi:hypothetical protein Riv7116_6418 [Rivularia sp. PCC 7116]|uniref:hypothetical protein n=1 Tax=Rivularia sp. PCC 7116 TaxID=373994 RepID=UPI00029EE437|nr:hypothetical protein [Rivularia sp. PCC 7116]AFY58755.1 hypothetical protein Riv7116_6418 [Rivularia sp. PCC 7116]